MKLTAEFLKEKNACKEAQIWFKNQTETDLVMLLKYSIKNDFHLDWANWIITRCFTHDQQIRYAIYAAKQVLPIFEVKYPNDKRPRKAINAALRYLKNYNAAAHAADAAADAAAHAADAAADAAAYAADAVYAADAAADAAYAAAYAAHAAAYAAYAAHAAADAAYAAADAAAYAAAYAAYADKKEIQIKILKYGIGLITKK